MGKMKRIVRKFFGVQSAVTTVVLIALIFSMFTQIQVQSPATTMHKKVDIFKGRFSSPDVVLRPNQAVDVSFSICPTMDVPETVIRFIMPADLVRLVKGKSVWTGDVKKGETVNLKFSIMAEEEVSANVRVDVEAPLSGKNYHSSYYLHVAGPDNKLSGQAEGRLKQVSPEMLVALDLESPSPAESSSPQSPGTFRIKGRLLYVNEEGGYSPARIVKVEIWDQDTGLDDKLKTGYTDLNGYFDITAPNDDGVGRGTADPYIKFFAESRYHYWVTKTGGFSSSIYRWRYPKSGTLQDDVPDGWVKDVGALAPTTNNEALQAGDAAYEEAKWIWNQVNWQRSKRVIIKWPDGDWPQCDGDVIFLPSKKTWNWTHVTVHHEYAHAVMYNLYGHFPSGDGPNPHWVGCESSRGFAMTEGWAEFMECVVDNDINNLQGWGISDDGKLHGGNIEDNDWYNCEDTGDMDGYKVEGSIASILWDIYDPKSAADRDDMHWGFNEIFTVIRYDKPENIDEFWSKWITRWPESTSKGPLSTIYWHYGVDKDSYRPWGTITINSGATYTTSRTVTLTLSAVDYGSGVYKMRFQERYSGLGWSEWEAYSTSKEWTLTSSGDGTKEIYVEFMDKKGHVSKAFYDEIILDTVRPKGSIVIGTNNQDYTKKVEVLLCVTYSDDTSGVDKVRYKNMDGSWTEWEDPPSPTLYPHLKAWTLLTGDGIKTVYYQIRDKAGWLSEEYSDAIILDTAKPTGSIVINSGNPAYTESTSVTLHLTYSDATSGVKRVRYSNDGVWDTESWEAPSATKAWTLTTGDGTKTVYYQIEDRAGWRSPTYSDTITLDTAPPTGSITINGDATYSNTMAVTLTLSATDTTSGVVEMRFSNDNIEYTEWQTYATSQTWNLAAGDGSKTVYVQFRDNAGLVSSTYEDTIILDTTKPEANAGVDQTVAENTLVVFDATLSTDENGIALYAWTFTDRTPQNLNGKNPTYTFATPGIYTITLEVTDPAGNTNTDTVTITVLDITKPTANAGFDQTVDEDALVTFDASASSDNMGIISYTWTFTDADILQTLEGASPTYTFHTPGVYTITLNVTDAAGNWATDVVIVTVLDITNPVADAGQDQTVNVGETVNFDASASTDNVNVVSYEWDFGDGTTGTGVTTSHVYSTPETYIVTLTVKDAAGNTATHSITITVLPAPTEALPLWIIGAVIALLMIVATAVVIFWRKRK